MWVIIGLRDESTKPVKSSQNSKGDTPRAVRALLVVDIFALLSIVAAQRRALKNS